MCESTRVLLLGCLGVGREQRAHDGLRRLALSYQVCSGRLEYTSFSFSASGQAASSAT